MIIQLVFCIFNRKACRLIFLVNGANSTPIWELAIWGPWSTWVEGRVGFCITVAVVINFVCQLDEAMGYTDLCSNIILGMSLGVFLDGPSHEFGGMLPVWLLSHIEARGSGYCAPIWGSDRPSPSGGCVFLSVSGKVKKDTSQGKFSREGCKSWKMVQCWYKELWSGHQQLPLVSS